MEEENCLHFFLLNHATIWHYNDCVCVCVCVCTALPVYLSVLSPVAASFPLIIGPTTPPGAPVRSILNRVPVTMI
jgi:hypothetical protein